MLYSKKTTIMKTNLLRTLNIGDMMFSPVCGDCVVIALDMDEYWCITVRSSYGSEFSFDKHGRMAIGGQPLLFKI